MSVGCIGEQLSSDQLAQAGTLPTKPAAVTLEGRYVRLLPLNLDRDLEALHTISNGQQIISGTKIIEAYNADEMIWQYMSMGPFANANDLSEFLGAQIEAQNGLPFTVFDKSNSRPVGVCNFMNNFPGHLKIELGNIWYGPIAQRTNANLEATSLMLSHLFSLGYRRVEWKCDALNERSRRAAERMGFQFECVQESHFIVKNRNRDTAWYRILDREWPVVRERLRSLLA